MWLILVFGIFILPILAAFNPAVFPTHENFDEAEADPRGDIECEGPIPSVLHQKGTLFGPDGSIVDYSDWQLVELARDHTCMQVVIVHVYRHILHSDCQSLTWHSTDRRTPRLRRSYRISEY